MSKTDTSLDGTLAEVIGQSISSNEGNKANETSEGISQEANSEETKSGGTPEYVAGIDISDIPEQDRTRVKAKLEEKAKLLEKGYNVKFQEISKFKKAQEDLTSMGLSVDEARDVLAKHIEQKKNPVTTTAQKEKAIKTLDKLIDSSSYEQKPALEQMRQIILEETDSTEIKKELSEIKAALGMVSQSAFKTKEREINQELDTIWTKKFGKDFIEKHREKISAVALKFPNESISKIIKIETPDDEYEQAILSEKLGNRKPLTEEKRNSISSATKSVSSSDKIDIKKNSLSQIMMEQLKK